LFPAISGRLVSLICSVTIIILILLYAAIEYDWEMFSSEPKYSLNFNNTVTYANGDLSIVVGGNRLDTSKNVYIHGVENQTIIFTSLLSTETGKEIDSLTFNNNQKRVRLIVNEDNVTSVDVSVPNLQSGKYYGWLYLTNGSTFTIPIIVSTEPKVIQAVILVVIGVLLSIIFWEIFFYIYKKFNQQTADRLKTMAPQALSTRAGFRNLNNDQIMAKQSEIVQRKEERVREVKSRYTENAIIIGTLDVALVTFGIITGLVGLMSNTYVTSLIEISWIDAITLIGIGLGIGSWKGIVEKKLAK
jgi:hypothetical protein